MKTLVCPELPTADLRSSQATHAAVDNSASFANRPQSTYKSGKVVQTSGATTLRAARLESPENCRDSIAIEKMKKDAEASL